MIQETISRTAAQRYYDRLGARYDWVGVWESRAKARALQLLDLADGQRVLNVGVGTGKELARIQAEVRPRGAVVALDLSPVMLGLTRRRTGAPVCRADARDLPFADARFEQLYASYVLDLLPVRDLPWVLAGFFRALTPGGLLVVAALTEGVTAASCLLTVAWKKMYTLSPLACGGCRPVQLERLARQAGFANVHREVIVQWGAPSEIVVGEKW